MNESKFTKNPTNFSPSVPVENKSNMPQATTKVLRNSAHEVNQMHNNTKLQGKENILVLENEMKSFVHTLRIKILD